MQNKIIIVSLTLLGVILTSVFFVAFLKGGMDNLGIFETIVGIFFFILAIVMLFTMMVLKIKKLNLINSLEDYCFEIVVLSIALLALSILLIFK